MALWPRIRDSTTNQVLSLFLLDVSHVFYGPFRNKCPALLSSYHDELRYVFLTARIYSNLIRDSKDLLPGDDVDSASERMVKTNYIVLNTLCVLDVEWV
jgi:hypothetical protein